MALPAEPVTAGTPVVVMPWRTAYSADETEQVSCPGCGARGATKLADEWSLGIVCCEACDLVYVSPRLRNSQQHYGGDPEQTLRKYGAIFAGGPHNRDRNYREHLDVIRRIKPEGRLLDIGSHCGFFLRMARDQGWELHGIEPSPSSAALAREKFGLDVQVGLLECGVFPAGYFDVVTMVDVFEHVTNPRELLSAVYTILRPGGILFLKVPNVRWSLLKYRLLTQTLRLRGFDVFDSREHVVHYSETTLARLLESEGFRVRSFHVPRPIQTGAWWKRAGRAAAWVLARVGFRLLGRLGSLATDVACVAQRPPATEGLSGTPPTGVDRRVA